MRVALSALIAATALAAPQLAHATAMDSFSLSGANGLSVTFSAPASPTPTSTYSFFTIPIYFEIGPLTFQENGVTHTLADAYFYTKYDQGGFALDDALGNVIDDLSFTGPTLFKGGIDHPTFKLGSFDLQNSSNCDPATLTIAPMTSTTPEPESLLLLGTGALGAVGLLRRRFSL